MTQKALEIAADGQVYARRSDLYRSENTTGNQEPVVGFGELSSYETDGGLHQGRYLSRYPRIVRYTANPPAAASTRVET